VTLIVLLFAIGLFLLAAEVLVPGGILGIAGGLALLAGSVLSFVEFGKSGGLMALLISGTTALAVFYIELRILPKTRFGKRFFLSREISGSAAPLKEDARDLVGKAALSATVLAPSGYVTIGGKRYEAVSQSGQIPQGSELIVVDANAFQLTVRTKH
jgi:membrane-bound ClpP family serine protease